MNSCPQQGPNTEWDSGSLAVVSFIRSGSSMQTVSQNCLIILLALVTQCHRLVVVSITWCVCVIAYTYCRRPEEITNRPREMKLRLQVQTDRDTVRFMYEASDILYLAINAIAWIYLRKGKCKDSCQLTYIHVHVCTDACLKLLQNYLIQNYLLLKLPTYFIHKPYTCTCILLFCVIRMLQ